MKMERWQLCFECLLLLGVLFGVAACNAGPDSSGRSESRLSNVQAASTDPAPTFPVANAPYLGVKMLSPHSGCSFLSSPINFCDARHRSLIDRVIAEQRPSFNGHYIVAQLEEWPEFFQRSVVVVNSRTGIVYPLPIDALSGPLSSAGRSVGYGIVETSVEAEEFCLVGAVLAYRSINEGRFCFGFDGVRFAGHKTPYMASDGQG